MTMTAKFPGTCNVCRSTFPAGAAIDWSRATGARCADQTACAAAKAARVAAPPAAPAVTLNVGAVATFLTAARDRGLQYPKVRFCAPGGELRLSLAGSGSRYPGAMQVKIDDEWIGRVEVSGTVAGPLASRSDVLAALVRIAADPAAAAREYGALAGRCSFCNLGLTDAGSVEVGYGPVCAKNYGLPHHAKGSPTLSPIPVARYALPEQAA